ncbi:TIGR03745 family integrating conjugative element membrane protein [Aquisalimonas lutea]|uniref:TIGR03745 family integrating conjugative element membrane protein n=1 Tax=Aquisalimonas lutea TaxID=1327750 RepID=UPI003F4959A3
MCKRLVNRVLQAVAGTVGMFICVVVQADLPDAPEPEGGYEDGNWLDLMQGYFFEGGTVLATLVSMVGFVWVSWTGLTKFNEARQGRAEWGEVGLLGIVGGALLLVISFLLNQALSVTG